MAMPSSTDPEDEGLRVVYNKWPQFPSDFREACQEYAGHAEKLAFRLLELISLSLGLPKERFHDYFKEQMMSFFRINRYPPCPRPDLALGVGHHKDADVISLLAQDEVGGLQISRRSDGVWFPIRPVPNALVINIGNCMEVWTNDKYWSAEHRVVVNSTRERYSIPFFLLPSHNVEVKPLEELLSPENPPRYKGYKYGKFYVSRNRSDFKKLEIQNIQIDDFKVIEFMSETIIQNDLFDDDSVRLHTFFGRRQETHVSYFLFKHLNKLQANLPRSRHLMKIFQQNRNNTLLNNLKEM
ncbi:hypothetical protein YC2023_061713 [Brassica napus]